MEIEIVNEIVSEIKKPAWKGWGVTNNVGNVPCSLQDVMSEQLAVELENKDVKSLDLENVLSSHGDEIPREVLLKILNEDDSGGGPKHDNDTSNDFVIASFLQHEFDKNHDLQLRREQDKWNGQSKVKVSYMNHRTIHPALQADADFDERLLNVPEVEIKKDMTPHFNKHGISGKGKNIVTKHDPIICGRRNANRVLETFPPEFETGDDTDFDMRLPNNVYNRLKIQSINEIKRSNRHHEKKEHSTQLSALDMKTKVLLYKMQLNGLWNSLNGIVSTGKESIVFHASGGSSTTKLIPAECAVKVFKTTLSSFKNRCDYIKGDVRFFKDEFKKQNPRKIMKIWAEKEETNLRRMQRFNLPCPEPIALKKHILVMSFIGQNQVAAPKLSGAMMSLEEYHDAYHQCIDILTRMYNDCKLVHGDFSEFNTLWHGGVVHVIDVAQAVDYMHPRALEFLVRDCQNITKFFVKHGVLDACTWQDLFNRITKLDITGEGKEFIAQLQRRADTEATMKLGFSKTDYPFDYFFNKSCHLDKAADEEGDKEEEEDDDDSDDDSDDDDEQNLDVKDNHVQ